MFCANCGTKMAEGQVFCGNCGARQVSAPTSAPTAGQAGGPVHVEASGHAPAATRSVPSALVIGGIAALVFACGLGAFLAVRASNRTPEQAPAATASAVAPGPTEVPAPIPVQTPPVTDTPAPGAPIAIAGQAGATPDNGSAAPAFQPSVATTPKQNAYLDLIAGDVGFQRGDDPQGEWTAAAANSPLAAGDSLNAANKDSRAELQVGDGNVVRLGNQATASILENSDEIFQLKLTSGLATVRVDQLNRSYEIDTPTMAFLPQETGEYQFQVDPQGVTNVTVTRGKGLVTTPQGQQLLSAPASVQVAPSAAPAAAVPTATDPSFAQWNQTLDTQANQSPSMQNLPPGVPGATDLDQTGRWVPYGNGMAWVPNGVSADWQPYQAGRWLWEPYGWTWVSEEPWGWAPYHYGSWAFASGVGWVWVPGSRLMRPMYAPARVVFVANGASFGWFPLAPGELYMSMYEVGFRPRPVVGFINYRHVLVIDRAEMVGVHYRYARVDYHVFDHAEIVQGVPRDVRADDRRVMFAREAEREPRVDRRFVPPAGRLDRPLVVAHPVPPRRDLNGHDVPQGHVTVVPAPARPTGHAEAEPPSTGQRQGPQVPGRPGTTAPDRQTGPGNSSGTKTDQTKTNQTKTEQTKTEQTKPDAKKAPPCPKPEPGKPAPKGCGGLFKHL